MVGALKYILSFPIKNRVISIGDIVRDAKHIAVIFPVDRKDRRKDEDIGSLIKKKFTGCNLSAIVSEESAIMGFDEVIYFPLDFPIFGRRYFERKGFLRRLKIDISFDLNDETDLITYLIGAHLRIGIIDSPFFNLIVKTDNLKSLFLDTDELHRYAPMLG